MNENLVERMGHLTFQVVDLDAAVFDAKNITGMNLVEGTTSRAVVTSNTRRGEITFLKGETNGCLAIGLEVRDSSVVNEVARRCKSAGVEMLSDVPFAPGVERGLRFKTTDGEILEVHTPVPRDQPKYYQTFGVRPRRLDHASINTTDPEGLRDFLTDILGVRLSDVAGNNDFQWFRGCDHVHHCLGAVRASASSLHHYSFEITDFSDFARLGDTLRSYNRTLVWGPGHHGAGAQSYFTYHLDTFGALVEYSKDLYIVENEQTYGNGDVWPIDPPASGDWINMWGAGPPQVFINAGAPFLAAAR